VLPAFWGEPHFSSRVSARMFMQNAVFGSDFKPKSLFPFEYALARFSNVRAALDAGALIGNLSERGEEAHSMNIRLLRRSRGGATERVEVLKS
jgi:hypothetical protein